MSICGGGGGGEVGWPKAFLGFSFFETNFAIKLWIITVTTFCLNYTYNYTYNCIMCFTLVKAYLNARAVILINKRSFK